MAAGSCPPAAPSYGRNTDFSVPPAQIPACPLGLRRHRRCPRQGRRRRHRGIRDVLHPLARRPSGTRKRARASPSPPPGRRRSRPGRSSAIWSTVVTDPARPYPVDLPGGSSVVHIRDGDPVFAASDRHMLRFMGLEPASHSLRSRQATPLQPCRCSRPGVKTVDNRER